MYSLLPDERIVVKLTLPELNFPFLYKGKLKDIYSEICETITKKLGSSDPDLASFDELLLDTLLSSIMNEVYWDSESDSYDRIEAEQTMLVLNFIEANRAPLTVLVYQIENVYNVMKIGLKEHGRVISSVIYKRLKPTEMMMEFLYEREFSANDPAMHFTNPISSRPLPDRW